MKRYALIPEHPTRKCHKCKYGCYLNEDRSWNCAAGIPDEDPTVCERHFQSIYPDRKENIPEHKTPYPSDYDSDKM